jgi:hypothetical protein
MSAGAARGDVRTGVAVKQRSPRASIGDGAARALFVPVHKVTETLCAPGVDLVGPLPEPFELATEYRRVVDDAQRHARPRARRAARRPRDADASREGRIRSSVEPRRS